MPTNRGGLLLAGGLVLWATSASAQIASAQPIQAYACDRERARGEVRRLADAGVIAELSQFPPNVSVIVDKRRWDRTAAAMRRRWAQDVACATGERFANMLRTVTFRARDTTLLGSFSDADLTD